MQGRICYYYPRVGRGVLVDAGGREIVFEAPDAPADLQGGDVVEFSMDNGHGRQRAIVRQVVTKWFDHLTEEDRRSVRQFIETLSAPSA